MPATKRIGVSTDQYAMRSSYDASGREEYIGETYPANQRQQSQPVWRIARLYYDGASTRVIAVLWANGSAEFRFRWDQRTTYTYG